jgi:hypothetical protein
MRLIESEGERRLSQVQLYLSAAEARKLVAELGSLLADPEKNEHFHVFSDDGGAELSCSIVTARKLADGAYTKAEREAFGKWRPKP